MFLGSGRETYTRSLKAAESPEYKFHPLVYRPWGSFESLAVCARFQFKRIPVNLGHSFRCRRTTIVPSIGLSSMGVRFIFIRKTSPRMVHRLKNFGKVPLVIIESQSGSYLGEDDIVRFEDAYGRDVKTKA